MIKTLGNNIVNAFTGGNPVKAIYTYGEKVWPITTERSYYISWTPSNISGTFSMFGQTYNLEDYSGYYSWMGDSNSARITSNAFKSISLTSIKTNVEIIENNAFENCTSLSRISASNILYISNNAFRSCGLLSINFPVCSYIGEYAFAYCKSLSKANLPKVLCVSKQAFYSGKSLSILLPKCSVIGNRAFENLGGRNLYISCPVCERYETQCFNNAHLTSADKMDFTSCKYIGDFAFGSGAIGLYTSYPVFEFPNCSYIGGGAFENCGFKYIKLSNVKYIGGFAFEYIVDDWKTGKRVISIYTDSVCSLGNSYAFAVFRPSTSNYIFDAQDVNVPYSLLSSYKSANIWSEISDIIKSIPS